VEEGLELQLVVEGVISTVVLALEEVEGIPVPNLLISHLHILYFQLVIAVLV
jgi:hypothetical protein